MSPRPLAVLLAAAALGACATANVAVNRRFDFSRVKRVAVVDFKDYPRAPGSGDLVSGAFEQSLIAAGYDVVERAQVAQVIAEKRYAGLLNPKQTKELGRLLGVDALLLGRITDFAEPRTRVVGVDVVDDRTDPIYARRTRRVQNADGTWGQTTEEAVTGYRTRHIVRREPRNFSVEGRLGVSARLVFVPTGAVLWSGSDSSAADSFEDAARGLSDGILKAVKPTWPVAAK
jgi:hypothetical protein